MQLELSHSAISSWLLVWILLTAKRRNTNMKREENSDMMGVGIGQARLRVNKGRRDFFFFLHWGGRRLCLTLFPIRKISSSLKGFLALLKSLPYRGSTLRPVNASSELHICTPTANHWEKGCLAVQKEGELDRSMVSGIVVICTPVFHNHCRFEIVRAGWVESPCWNALI